MALSPSAIFGSKTIGSTRGRCPQNYGGLFFVYFGFVQTNPIKGAAIRFNLIVFALFISQSSRDLHMFSVHNICESFFLTWNAGPWINHWFIGQHVESKITYPKKASQCLCFKGSRFAGMHVFNMACPKWAVPQCWPHFCFLNLLAVEVRYSASREASLIWEASPGAICY